MRKFFCDICGEQMPPEYTGALKTEQGSVEEICHVTDVCPKCLYVGRNLNPRQIILAEWKRGLEKKNTKKGKSSKDGKDTSVRGRGSIEKRNIHAALVLYRERTRLAGGFAQLEELTGFSDTKLQNMLEGQKFPLEDWRVVGQALETLETPAG